jgi:uncharacterized membrane protein YhiD involved in acid resistance
VLLARLFAAAVLGGLAAAVYAWTHRRDETFTINFLATLVLLSILLATVTQVIGENLARAFGLVGALAIVRFRTVVEDSRDTAFVMLAVVVGMAAGAGYVPLAVVALSFSTVTALVLQPRRHSPESAGPELWTLTVRVGVGQDHEALMQAAFAKYLQTSRLLSTSTARQGAAIEWIWTVTLRAGSTPAALVTELNRLEGVQNVEVRREGK